MKFRTDFITNSSSSSFIFTHFDKKKIKMIAEKMLPSLWEKWKWSGWRYEELWEYLEYVLKNEVTEFKNLGSHDLKEIYDWYEDDVLCSIFNYQTSNMGSEIDIDAKFKELIKNEMSEEQENRWLAYLILHLTEEYYWIVHEEENKVEIVTKEYLNDILQNYIETGWENWQYEYVMEHYEMLLQRWERFVGMHLREVLACFFSAKYAYFCDYEIGYDHILKEIMCESGMCEFACVHMG